MKLYRNLTSGVVECVACEHRCKIGVGKTGVCGVRKNVDGRLELLVREKTTGVGIDPIEKKPLYHFLPGSLVYSIGTWGCNFKCQFCQNAWMSQKNEELGIKNYELKTREIVDYCVGNKIPSIAFTYNEPTIWSEWAVEIMKEARSGRSGIRGVFVTNGYMTLETLDYLNGYIDAYNVDLKSNSDDFYRQICGGRLEVVKRNIAEIYRRKKWIEVTTLLIPGKNDSREEIEAIAKFLVNISKYLPWHISAFYPDYKMTDVESTSYEKLMEAKEIGKRVGLKYVYIGNTGEGN